LVIEGLPAEFPPPRGLESQTVKEEFVAPRKRRLPLVAAVVVAVAVATAVAVYAATRGGTAAPAFAAPNSVAVIDPAKDRLVAELPVGDHPTRVVAGDGYVWALNEGGRAPCADQSVGSERAVVRDRPHAG